MGPSNVKVTNNKKPGPSSSRINSRTLSALNARNSSAKGFPGTERGQGRGQQLTGVCTACKNWMRKRDNKRA